MLRSAHAQTLGGWLLAGSQFPYNARQRHIECDDGDRLLLHDDCPLGWQPGDRVALLVHGMAGSHLSPYVVRVGYKLNEHVVRTFRMDLRGAGESSKIARQVYHAGRTDDLITALNGVRSWCPDSPLSLLGFSLGGALILKLLNECADEVPDELVQAIAVCPPLDLTHCAEAIGQRAMQLYERYFVNCLMEQVEMRRRANPNAIHAEIPRRPTSVWEFDDTFTAPVCGFESAADYYRRASCGNDLQAIRVSTSIIMADDDPIVPSEQFESLQLARSTQLVMTEYGGHLGFIAANGPDPDRRWMDWRIVRAVAGPDSGRPSMPKTTPRWRLTRAFGRAGF